MMITSKFILKAQGFEFKNYFLSLQMKDFKILENEKILITGPSGCGKSTLLKILSGLIYSENLTVEFQDHKISDFLNFRRKSLSYLSQDLNFIEEFNIFENFKIEIPYDFTLKFDELYQSLKFTRKINFLEKTQNFSFGEKQKIALIRQILKPHELLFLDEPTSNLDTLSAEAVFKLIQQHSKTTLVVSHDHRWSHLFDRVIDINQILNITSRAEK